MITISAFLRITCISLFFITLACPASSQGIETPEEIATRLQLRHDGMKSLLFNFFQDTRGEMTGKPRKASGKAVFYKNEGIGKMRWDYSTPEKQVLLSDGIRFFMYFSNLEQMIISPAAVLDSDLTYSFFTGTGNLLRDFYIQAPGEEFMSEGESLHVIKLTPRTPQSQVQDIHLWVSTDSLIRRINILDHFGTITVLSFSNIQVDTLIEEEPEKLVPLFSFTPPEGTEIIEQ